MRLAISGQALGTVKTLEEILEILRKYNVDAIELWPANIPPKANASECDPYRYEGRSIERAKELLKAYKVSAACVTMPGGYNQALVSNAENYVAALAYAVEVAAELGAPVINHYAYHLTPDENSDLVGIRRFWDKAIEKAERQNIFLALENEHSDATRTPEGMLRILEYVGSHRFGTNYDACNYYHASQEGYPYAYDVLKQWIFYVHIKNGCIYNPRAGHLETSKGMPFFGAYSNNLMYYIPLGEGALNIDALLSRLEKDGYDGFCTLEPHTAPELVERYYAAEVAYLQKRGFLTMAKRSKKGGK